VSAILTPGSGGDGIDKLEFRTMTGTTWSAWTSYISGSEIPTTGKSGVEVRTGRVGACWFYRYNTKSWVIEEPPVAENVFKVPNVATVCEGTMIMETSHFPGSGGNGIDELEYRTKTGETWSGWTTYTISTPISTAGLSGVEVHSRRMANFCSPSEYNTVSWNVEATPVAGTLTKIPDMSSICEGAEVTALLSPGTGGNGTDLLEYRMYDGINWSEYTPFTLGTSIGTVAKTIVEIRTKRLADVCNSSDYNSVSWTIVSRPMLGEIIKYPAVSAVCEGTTVSATFVPGSGGLTNVETITQEHGILIRQVRYYLQQDILWLKSGAYVGAVFLLVFETVK
jgi:hypothetical protein